VLGISKEKCLGNYGCKTVRLDKVEEHEESSEHLNSVFLKLEREQAKQVNDNMDKDSHKAISDTLKEPAVGYFLKSGRFNH
jgi:hypothetical protein